MTQENGLVALRRRWLTTGSFQDEQAYLAARVRTKNVPFVYLDPDGTSPEWLAIVVRCETGVVYGTQCAGVATEQRFIEGYLVLVGGSKYAVDEGNIEVTPFRDIFHEQDACKSNWAGRALPSERQELLSNLVEAIPYWHCNLDGDDQRHQIQIDKSRVEEIAEAWIPVQTPVGAGVLLYKNCD